jgi:MFS family permease
MNMPTGQDQGSRVLGVVARVFLPFAAAYFLSYLFRTINGTISGSLMAEFHLDAGNLGLLTSIYFLSFAAAQLPLGALIDSFGPRRVQSGLLLFAALGAAGFALAGSLPTLLAGRILIGLGVSGALMAGLKGLVLWVPKDRIALFNGCFIMFGGLGAIAATKPVEAVLGVLDWRGVFWVLAGATVIAAAAIWTVVPERTIARKSTGWKDIASGMGQAFDSPAFWRLAPISALVIATAWSAQGLWAARWFADVEHLDAGVVASRLFWMSVTLTVGAVLIGIIADRVKRYGVSSSTIFGTACGVFLVIQLAVIERVPIPDGLLWAGFAVFGGMTVLSYSMIAEHFPQEAIGRTNGALNVLHIGTACVLQYAMGVVTSLWSVDAAGHYPVAAYRAAFGLPLLLEIAALIWFLTPIRATRVSPAKGRGQPIPQAQTRA